MPHSLNEDSSPEETLELLRQEASTLAMEYLFAVNSALGLLSFLEVARERFPELDEALANLAPEVESVLAAIPPEYRREHRELRVALARIRLVSRLKHRDGLLLSTLRKLRGESEGSECLRPAVLDLELPDLPVN